MACALALKKQEAVFRDEATGEEVVRPLGIESSLVMKKNTSLYPRRVLNAILKARHGKQRAGNWVVMSTNIKEVPLYAIAYAHSNNDTTYVITTMGDTVAALNPYVCFNTNNGYDSMDNKETDRPDIVEFLFQFLPKIDAHNKVRQNELQMEDQWPTKCCWVKMFVAFVGKSIANMQKLLKYVYPGVPAKDMTSKELAQNIAGGLKIRERRVLPVALRQQENGLKLQRITDRDGNTCKRLSPKQSAEGKRSKGSGIQRSCYNCKRYKAKYCYTSWQCPRCGTPLCNNE